MLFRSQAFNVSFGILAIWAAVGIGYSYVKEAGFGDVALQGGLTSLSAFFIVQSLSIANPITAALATGKEASGIGNLTGNKQRLLLKSFLMPCKSF